MKIALAFSGVAFATCLSLAGAPLPAPAVRSHASGHILLAGAAGTPTPNPTPKYRIMNFGGMSGGKK
jgi:hypothetical protein